MRDSYRRIRVAIARINAYLQEHVSGMAVLQLFNREKRAFDKFSEVNAVHMDAFKDAIMAHAVYYPLVEILSSVAIAGVIWFGGKQVLEGVSTLSVALGFLHAKPDFEVDSHPDHAGVLVAFIQYAQRFFRPIQDFSEKYNILQSAMASSERIFKLLDTPEEIASPAVTRNAGWAGPHRVRSRMVRLRLRKSSPGGRASHRSSEGGHPQAHEPDWVLRDVSFAISPGETVAIVGHTGAGKTTMISLLMRFYDVQRGAVKIDGVDVKEMDLADLRRRFGVVLQDPFLFTGTVAGKHSIRHGLDSRTKTWRKRRKR